MPKHLHTHTHSSCVPRSDISGMGSCPYHLACPTIAMKQVHVCSHMPHSIYLSCGVCIYMVDFFYLRKCSCMCSLCTRQLFHLEVAVKSSVPLYTYIKPLLMCACIPQRQGHSPQSRSQVLTRTHSYQPIHYRPSPFSFDLWRKSSSVAFCVCGACTPAA